MFKVLFEYQFLQNALFAGILSSIVCGIIGVIIVEKRLIMMSGGIAHTSYGGVGLGYLIGIDPIIGAFLFSLAAVFGVGYIKRKGGQNSEIIIGLFWSLGMALGVFFISFMDAYPPGIQSYLFGNILSVTKSDLKLMVVLTIFVVSCIVILFNNWKAYLFDEEFSFIIGIRTVFLEYLILALVAMTIVVLIRVVGIILVMALLTAPAAISAMFAKGLKSRMILAIALGLLFNILGLWISYEFELSSGAVIVMISVLSYFILYAFKNLRKKISTRKIIKNI